MSPYAVAETASAINLNHPGKYLSWSFIDISVANLIVIGVMVVIFGARAAGAVPVAARRAACAPGIGHARREHRHCRTGRARLRLTIPTPTCGPTGSGAARCGCCRLASCYPTGSPLTSLRGSTPSASPLLATLGLAIISGFALALGGPDWYHYNSVGHFFNSIHLWSVELFMAFMVIHLWGKFWMAAWRGRRAMTWITGVIAFMASVVECFTGYLSQSNFDSQWIATNGKDAFNAVGVGAFFNVMNFGQMLMWHIVLIPIVLVAIVGAHVLMVRIRGVVHPLPAQSQAAAQPRRPQGGRRRRRGALARRDPPLRHPEGGHGRGHDRDLPGAAHGRACCPRPTCRR